MSSSPCIYVSTGGIFSTEADCIAFCIGTATPGGTPPRDPDRPSDFVIGTTKYSDAELEEIKNKEPDKYDEIIQDSKSSDSKKSTEEDFCGNVNSIGVKP